MEQSTFKWIIGSAPFLASAVDEWRELVPEQRVEAIEIVQNEVHEFDFTSIGKFENEHGKLQGTAFAAFGPQFMNFRRLELMGALKERGLKLPPLISPGAQVSLSASIGENTWIGSGAVVAAGTSVGYNSYVGAGAIIGAHCTIGNSTWIEAGTIIGRNCKIGAFSQLGYGVILIDGIEVGKQCEIGKAGRYWRNVASKTFIHPDFDEEMVIVG